MVPWPLFYLHALKSTFIRRKLTYGCLRLLKHNLILLQLYSDSSGCLLRSLESHSKFCVDLTVPKLKFLRKCLKKICLFKFQENDSNIRAPAITSERVQESRSCKNPEHNQPQTTQHSVSSTSFAHTHTKQRVLAGLFLRLSCKHSKLLPNVAWFLEPSALQR